MLVFLTCIVFASAMDSAILPEDLDSPQPAAKLWHHLAPSSGTDALPSTGTKPFVALLVPAKQHAAWDQSVPNTCTSNDGEDAAVSVSKTQIELKKHRKVKTLHANFSKLQGLWTESSFLGQAPTSLTHQLIPSLALAHQPAGLSQRSPVTLGLRYAYFNPESCSLKQEEMLPLCFILAEGSVLCSSHCRVTEHPGSSAASDALPMLDAPHASPGKASSTPKPAAGRGAPTHGTDTQEISREA